MSVESLFGLLITLLIIGAILGLLVWLVDRVPMIAPYNAFAKAAIAIVGVIILIYLLLGLLPGGGIRIGG